MPLFSNMDPYDFDQDDYIESRDSDFSASFIEEIRDDESSDEYFLGFIREDIYGKNSRVRHFHERNMEDAEANQEDEESDIQHGWKRKANPSQ